MKTCLFEKHVEQGAKIVPFAGWDMPVQYTSIIQEHNAVREAAGVFDVSHMGRIEITGNDAAKFIDWLCTNDIAGLKDHEVAYAVLCDKEGRSIDDILVYKISSTSFFVVANSSNREKDLAHFQTEARNFDVVITPRYHEEGILALQGPHAKKIAEKYFPECKNLKPMKHVQSGPCIVSTTGYTGSGGVEIYAPIDQILHYWNKFIEDGVQPCGLGARDTLRLEMGYALYGHELSPTISPNESVARWTIKWEKDFLGKDALSALEPKRRHAYGVVLLPGAIARDGALVYLNEEEIGYVTSGTQSPNLQAPIALILVSRRLKAGDKVQIKVRQNKVEGEVTSLPFYQPKKRD